MSSSDRLPNTPPMPLKREGLIHAQSRFPPWLTLIVAAPLLRLGILAVFSMSFRVGPFG